MDLNMIITIGRQYGSGGREIGEKLAKRMNVPYYDKELLTEAARESGLSEELFLPALCAGNGKQLCQPAAAQPHNFYGAV